MKEIKTEAAALAAVRENGVALEYVPAELCGAVLAAA
jgi:hypothetical protein